MTDFTNVIFYRNKWQGINTGTEESHELLLGGGRGRQVIERLWQCDHILFNTYYLYRHVWTQNPELAPNF